MSPFLIAWLLCSVTQWRWSFRVSIDESDPGWVDVIWFCGCATFVALLGGPLILLGRLFSATIGRGDAGAAVRILGGESRDDKLARLESERAEREAHIARLEQELGIV